MTDCEKLNLIFLNMQDMQSNLQGMKADMQDMKSNMQDMKSDMQNMKSDMQDMKSDMQDMKSDMQELKRRTTNIELHLENHTDRNVQLIAENFIELTNKLNQAIPAADKNLAYEVKVNYLVEEVNKLKQDVAMLKDKTA